MSILSSGLGLKRLIASALSSLLDVLRIIPGAAEYISTIEMVAAFFGITGLVGAGTQGALSKKKLASASAALAFLNVVCLWVPALGPLAPYLQQIAALLGAAAIGSKIKEREIAKNEDVNPQDIDGV